MIWAAVKMALALGLAIAALILLSRISRKWQGRQMFAGSDGGIRVLTSKLIAPQKYVSLVEIAGEILALGVSSQQVTFLTKIENREWVRNRLADGQFKAEGLPWSRAFSLFHKKGDGPSGEQR